MAPRLIGGGRSLRSARSSTSSTSAAPASPSSARCSVRGGCGRPRAPSSPSSTASGSIRQSSGSPSASTRRSRRGSAGARAWSRSRRGCGSSSGRRSRPHRSRRTPGSASIWSWGWALFGAKRSRQARHRLRLPLGARPEAVRRPDQGRAGLQRVAHRGPDRASGRSDLHFLRGDRRDRERSTGSPRSCTAAAAALSAAFARAVLQSHAPVSDDEVAKVEQAAIPRFRGGAAATSRP